jgi:hypothetical protein
MQDPKIQHRRAQQAVAQIGACIFNNPFCSLCQTKHHALLIILCIT